MHIKNFLVFSLALVFLFDARAEIADLSLAPQPKEEVGTENKSPDITVTPAKKLEFRKIDGRERAYTEKNEPFSGATQIKDDEGLITTYYYRNGYKHGVAVAYAEDGHLELETTYRKGYKEGEEISFYENGKPKLKQTFAQDKLNGEEIIFYNNGKPERINHYVDGLLDGETFYIDQNGNTTKKETYKNGKKNGPEHIIANNMLEQENNYVDDVLDGIIKKYNQQNLVEEISYKSGKRDGISKKYLENGSWSETEYKNDVLNGIARSFYPDKTVAETVNYADNQRNGLAEKFNQKGVRTSSENYKNGKLEGISRKFNEAGELEKVSYYVNGIEMAVLNVGENTELRDIYESYRNNKLNDVISNKNLWYPVLWLGLNLEKNDILSALENEMKMYAADMADFDVFKRESKSRFEDYNRKLFFGLTPLSYAVNLSSSTEVLQKFATDAENIDADNPRGTTALVEAVRLNNLQMVKYLLAHQADVSKVYGGNNTILLYALKENAQNEIVVELIKAGADVNVADSNGQTPLLIAVSTGNSELLNLLSENNADIKQATSNGKSILFYAFENNVNPEIYAHLIKAGADVNQPDADGNILLLQALAAEKYELAKTLLQSGADIIKQNQNGDSALSYVLTHDVPKEILEQTLAVYDKPLENVAKLNKPLWKIFAEQNRYDLLKDVIGKMGGVNVKDQNNETVFAYMLSSPNNEALYNVVSSFLSEQDAENNSNLLFEAVKAKNLGIVDKLIELGADVNVKSEDGEPLLSYLIKKDYPIDYVKALEKGKLNINSTDAIQTAILQNNIELLKNLIENGADVNKLTADKQSYLMMLKDNQSEMTELLLQSGADIEYSPQPDKTMLMYAVKQANATLIKHLLEKGFSVDQRDDDGNDALMYIADMTAENTDAAEKIVADIKKIVPILQEKGADINNQNNNGETLLIRIAKLKLENYALIADSLIELGANADKKDQYGKTAIDYTR